MSTMLRPRLRSISRWRVPPPSGGPLAGDAVLGRGGIVPMRGSPDDLGDTVEVVPVQPLDDAEESLWRSLMRLCITLPRTLGEVEGASGVTGTKYALLMHLSEAPNRRLRMSDLAERMAFSAGRITRLVTEMVDAGNVRRVPSSEDGRSTLAELTDEGYAAVVEMHPVILRAVRRLVFDNLDAHEVQSTGQVLQRLVHTVEHAKSPRSRRQRLP